LLQVLFSTYQPLFVTSAMSASAVMSIPLLKFQKRTAFLRLVHLTSLHRLVKIYQMSVELRTIHTGNLDLVADLETTGSAHSGSNHHDRIHADDCRNRQFLWQKTYKLHHDHWPHCNTDIIFISVVHQFLYHSSNHTGMTV